MKKWPIYLLIALNVALLIAIPAGVNKLANVLSLHTESLITQGEALVLFGGKLQEIDARTQRLERVLSGNEPSRDVRSISVVATAYTPAVDEGGHLDALGTDLVPYKSIAVDPTVIPLGSRLLVKYQGKVIMVGIAQDTGSAIQGHRVDLCMPTKAEAREWGRKQVEVVVVQ